LPVWFPLQSAGYLLYSSTVFSPHGCRCPNQQHLVASQQSRIASLQNKRLLSLCAPVAFGFAPGWDFESDNSQFESEIYRPLPVIPIVMQAAFYGIFSKGSPENCLCVPLRFY